jgi:Type IV secretory pathway, TrbD component
MDPKMDPREIPGYEIDIHRSLTETILIAGVPRKFAIINGTFAAAIVLGARAFYLIPIFIIVHIIAVYYTKKDPQFFEVLKNHIHTKDKYYV